MTLDWAQNWTFVDWVIVTVLLCSTIAGLVQGFFRTACSLIGLLLGLTLAAWNYRRVAAVLLPVVRIEAVADAIAFFLIAILVGVICNLIGTLLGRSFDWLGLGCLDKIGGLILGFMQGVWLVTLVVVIAVAFFPNAQWLSESRLPRQFFTACRISMHMSPEELSERVRNGLRTLENESPRWIRPGTSWAHPGV
jgi:membrane protein required for colicin V production